MSKIIITQNLILASASIARQTLLQDVELPFTVIPSAFDEETAKPTIQHLSIPEQAAYLAEQKAIEVSQRYPESLILAADQIGELQGEAFFKPLTHEINVAILKSLSGKTHYQHTAACLYLNNKKLNYFFESVALTMRALSDEEIEAYVKAEQSYETCGGYRFEGLGKHLFTTIEGTQDSILGLPVLQILNFLYAQGYLHME